MHRHRGRRASARATAAAASQRCHRRASTYAVLSEVGASRACMQWRRGAYRLQERRNETQEVAMGHRERRIGFIMAQGETAGIASSHFTAVHNRGWYEAPLAATLDADMRSYSPRRGKLTRVDVTTSWQQRLPRPTNAAPPQSLPERAARSLSAWTLAGVEITRRDITIRDVLLLESGRALGASDEPASRAARSVRTTCTGSGPRDRWVMGSGAAPSGGATTATCNSYLVRSKRCARLPAAEPAQHR